MTTSAVRAAILVGAVIVGAVLIANAFPSGGTPGPSTSPSSSPSSSGPSPSATPPAPKLDCSNATDARVAVENATSTGGLAAAVANKLTKAGYKVNKNTDVGNASTQATTTTVYFRGADNKTAAKCLRKKFFHGTGLRLLPSNAGATPPIAAGVQVAVFLGSDYAAAHPVG